MSPRVIVRYFIGSSGRFLSTCLESLIEPIELVEHHRAHLNYEQNRFHNYNSPGADFKKYDEYTKLIDQSPAQLTEGSNWFRDNVKFYTTKRLIHKRSFSFFKDVEPAMYIISCHAYNPIPMMMGFRNSRLINIEFTETDVDQISYNFATKNIIGENRQTDLVEQIRLLKFHWPKILNPIDIDAIDWDDIRQLTFIIKWLNMKTTSAFNTYSKELVNKFDQVYNVQFSDISNGNLSNILPDIVKFLGITVTEERMENARLLISQYSSAQTPVPWSLDLSDGQALGF